MKYLIFLINLVFLFPAQVNSQVNGVIVCPSDDVSMELKKQNPEYKNKMQDYEKKYSKQFDQNLIRNTDTLYTLPTVVHIIHSGQVIGTLQNPSNASIQRMVTEANQRFRHLHSGAKTYSNPHYGADTKIEFSLAQIDPAGNATNGIKRYNLPNLANGTYNQLQDGLNNLAWDKSKYANLFIVVDLTNASGVYISGRDFTIFDSEIIWSGLICHELGHYLSLAHIFYPETGTCLNNNCLLDGDFICDTPPKPQSGYGNGVCGDPGNSCSSDDDDLSANNPYRPVLNGGSGDQPDMLENYMDYTGPCWDSFTEGQKNRMRFNIEQLRMSMVEHAKLVCFEGCDENEHHNLNLTNAYVVSSTLNEVVEDIAIDSSGNRYAIGSFSGIIDFDPDENEVFQLSASGVDVFLTKFNDSGEFIGAFKIGGTSTDNGVSIDVDLQGNLYFTGNFRGTVDFDPGSNTYNLISNGNRDIFLCKFTPSGQFVWAKNFGGTGDDIIYSLDVNNNGRIALTGSFVQEVDFNPGSGIATFNGGNESDVFVTSFDSDGAFLWAARMGDEEDYEEWGSCTAIDEAGNVVLTGNFSGEVDFDPGPSTVLLNSGNNSNWDVFLCKLNATGALLWAGRIGGIGINNLDDYGNSILIDENGDFSVIGSFQSTVDFNPDPLITQYVTSRGEYDVFICKFKSNGVFEKVVRIGGEDSEAGWYLVSDPQGNLYASGWFKGIGDYDPGEQELLLFPRELQENYYLVKIDTSGGLLWAEQFNAQFLECREIEVDSDGTLYAVGQFAASPSASDFDPGAGAYSIASIGGYDGFVIKLCQISVPEITLAGSPWLCPDQTVSISSSNAFSYLWNTEEVTQSIIVNSPGCYRLTITNEAGCSNFSNVIKILPASAPSHPVIIPNGPTSFCEGESVILSVSPNEFQTYTWSNGATSPSTITNISSTFTVTVTDIHGCVAIAEPLQIQVNANPATPIIQPLGSTTFCEGGSVVLQVTNPDSNLHYNWNNGSNTPGIDVGETGYYYVQALTEFDCSASSNSIEIIVNPLPNTAINQTDTTLIAQENNANYQWLSCPSFAILPGKIEKMLVPEVSGDYAVEIQKNGCIDTSDCIFFEMITNVDESNFENLRLYPNPTTGIVHIESMSCQAPLISVHNLWSHQVNCAIVQHGTISTIDLKDYPAGVYLIDVECDMRKNYFKVIKL